MHDETSLIKQTIRQGANGYLTKDSSADEVKEALEKVIVDHRYLPRKIAEQLAFAEQTKEPSTTLTNRELEILHMIAIEGISLLDIAKRLNISPKTVTSHKGNIMVKIHAHNNADLMRLAQKILA